MADPRSGASRIRRVCLEVAGIGLGVVGLLGAPGVVLTICLFAVVLVGPGVGAFVHAVRGNGPVAVRAGAAATGAAIGLGTVVTGVGVLLGPAAAPLLALTAAAVAGWVWRRRRVPGSWGDRLRSVVPARGGPPVVVVPQPLVSWARLAVPALTELGTTELCVLWRRSYWLLGDLPTAHERCELAAVRQGLLDELERRDPAGFRRWLDGEPRANSDPRGHLGTEH